MTQATLTHFWMFFILLKSKKPIRRNMVLVATDPSAAMDPAANHGVPVNTHFFPENYAPSIEHEYQFDLDTNEGQLALERSVKFVDDFQARESDQQHCPC
jgi:hypothetical protein